MIEVRYNFPDTVAVFTLDEWDVRYAHAPSLAALALSHVEYGAQTLRDDCEGPIIVEIVPTTRKIEGVEHRPQVRIL